MTYPFKEVLCSYTSHACQVAACVNQTPRTGHWRDGGSDTHKPIFVYTQLQLADDDIDCSGNVYFEAYDLTFTTHLRYRCRNSPSFLKFVSIDCYRKETNADGTYCTTTGHTTAPLPPLEKCPMLFTRLH